MNLRFALGLLAAGFAFGAAQAQPYPPPYYPPANSQVYPPYRPVPGAMVPDDDDDDLPPHLRAAPGNYPPPPGGYVFPDDPRTARPAPGGMQREALPAPGQQGTPTYGNRGPAVVYGDRPGPQGYPPAYPPPAYGGAPAGNGQPESYGAAPQPGYAPNQAAVPQPYSPYGGPPAAQEQGPMQLGPGARPPADVAGRDATGTVRPNSVAMLPPEDQPETGKAELPPQFKRQLVTFPSSEPAGTIVIDTAHTYLYLVLGNGQAMRYGIGVGREGFTWAGAERVSKMSEWPDWHPPAEMIERQPYLPRFMAGGEGNPLGARALYLGKTLYRIHGTNQPSTIGKYVSSGCIRLTNDDIQDLYSRVQVGTRVVVLPGSPPATASAAPAQAPVQQR
jgi:lipoprotein-anchoring transpeptidase ErfK/SrfK